MTHLIAPATGFNFESLQLPELDFGAAFEVLTEPDAEQAVDLDPGVYYLVSDFDFSFCHLSQPTETRINLPWPKTTYLTLFVSKPQILHITTEAESGTLKIVPAKGY